MSQAPIMVKAIAIVRETRVMSATRLSMPLVDKEQLGRAIKLKSTTFEAISLPPVTVSVERLIHRRIWSTT
jgi:hypothetical protein